jgi:uncharacterized membrane protein YheB (UPF0754 family)
MSLEALFANPQVTFWKVIFPPLVYSFHGWFATRMAIAALFRPYNPIMIGSYQLPLTPGIFPKRRSKLAESVAQTVTDTLLTTTDIRSQAETLVTEQNIYTSVDLFVDSVLKEFRDTSKLHRLASDLAELSPTLLQHLVESTIESVEQGREQKVAAITEKIFDQVILSTRISLDQANELAAYIIEAFITPTKVRNVLISVLSPQNINAVDESIQAHASGPYKILARIIGVKRVCYEWRTFLEKEPEESQKIINDLIKRFGIRDQIAVQIANFDMRSLPLQTIARFKQDLVRFVETFIVEHKADLLESVKRVEVEAMGTVRSAIVRFNPESIPEVWLKRAKQDITTFAYSYLKRELGELLGKAIPALGMHSMIARKIDQFSAEQLENLVKRICSKELILLEWFGGGIGLGMGLIQIVINACVP